MEPPVVPDGEVTLAGAGHHAVSLGDVERARRASVLAYCARICDPARIAEAADAAFAGLHAALEAAPSYQTVDLERALLEATREAAAQRVDAAAAAVGRLGSRRATKTCSLMPTLLAARASGRLGASDRAGVERHIARCAACRDLEQRRDEAEQAYAALTGTAVEPDPAAEPFAPGDPEPEVFASRPEDGGAGEDAAPASDDEPYGYAEEVPAPLPQPDEVAEEPEAFGEAEAEAFGEAETEALGEPEALHEPEPEAVDERDAFELRDLEAPPAAADAPLGDETAERTVPDEPAAPENGAMDARLLDPPEFGSPVPAPGHTEEFDVQAELDREESDEPWDPRAKLPTWRDGAPVGGTRTRRRPSWALIGGLFLLGVVILVAGLLQLGGDDDSGTTATRPAERQTAAAPAPATEQPAAEPQPSRAELRRRARLRSLGDRELGPGTTGDDVRALQKLLGVSPTGNFGELTTLAVRDFQAKNGLPATGIADEATKRKLARRSRPPRQAPTPPASQTGPQGQATPGAQGQTTPGTQGGSTPPTAPQGQAPQTPPAGTPPTGQPPAGQ